MDRLDEYYKNALLSGLCSEYKNEWRSLRGDREGLMKLALRQQSIPHLLSYAYNGNGLTKEYIESNFKNYINGFIFNDCDAVNGFTYQLWLNAAKSHEIHVKSDVNVFMWCKDVDLIVKETKCPTLYVGCKSKVNITLCGYNSIRVYLFDESEVMFASTDETCDAIVYNYGKNSNVIRGKYSLSNNIKVFDKELKL